MSKLKPAIIPTSFNPSNFTQADMLDTLAAALGIGDRQAEAIWRALLDARVVIEWAPQEIGERRVYRLGGANVSALRRLARKSLVIA